ncbi:MAG: carboxypeptidase-like regulatory domain-containing protein, partial [Muribaculaceae bacterium]|nr:carboxypeptidase-like regulatory domain-containing protein [Muribaculaceae bacterium]
NNPAVDFMEKIRSAADLTDPHRHDYYNYEKYEKITLALNDFNPNEGSWVDRKFKFVKEHIDTSDVSGKPILNVSVKEKSSAVHFRKNPKSEKEHVHGIKRDGVDQIMGEESMQEFFEDIFREIDIYDKDINILQNRFVSPLSPIAAEFYKFYLSDTIVVDGDSCVALSFVPRVSETFGFTGRLYVPKNDSTMFIKRVDLHVPHDINLNFVETMSVSQEYTRASDGTRLKTKDDMTIEFSVIPGAQGLYARRNTAYANHDFSIPSDDSIFNHGAYRMISSDAYKRDYEFWETKRLVEIERGEKSVSQLLAQMRSVPLYYWGEKFLKIMVTGYISPTEKSPIFIGPMNTTASYNAAEGLRLRLGGMTNAYLSKRWFGRGYVAYGLRDQKWKYRGEVEYSFIDKKNHSREFPVKSLRLTHLYDVDQLGQQYIFTNQDNLFLSFKRMDDDRVTYHRKTMLDYTLE